MARVHLFEFHDQEWFPAVWRDLLTDFLAFFFKSFKPYLCVSPILADALEEVPTTEIVDLCSGAGQSILSLLPALHRESCNLTSVTLTDKFPNLLAFRSAVALANGTVRGREDSIDAADVPEGLTGFRTLFTSLHHFEPSAARKILADAAKSGQGIGIFEFTERNWALWTLPVLMIPIMIWLVTPLIRPFRLQRLVWTYLIPVVPLVAMWDGLVSNLRSYSIAELEALVEGLGEPGYAWRAGRVPSIGLSRVTYLVGFPDPIECAPP